ncbi:MAG: Hsp20/alpha crystallin family protein [Alphaproteobacteria bacterium]|nr:Hsp20/alpha crystallin family protein [Alphaproteobacteria bacterium]
MKEKLFDDNPFANMHNEMDRLLANFFDEDRWPALTNGNHMVVRWDVSETDDAVKISADLPGLSEKDIDVTLADGVLTIKGERKSESETEEKDKQYHRIERSYGSFERAMSLPSDVDESKIVADFKNGVLELTLPKKPEAKKKAKKIQVKAA